MKKTLIGLAVVIALVVAYWLLSPLWRVVKMNEALPAASGQPAPKVLSQGTLVPHDHDVSGRAKVLRSGSTTYLRFEDLNTVNGPDLRIYLGADLNAKDYVDLGPIKATQGNVNYVIPAGTDLAKYHYALIWCRSFVVLFSSADLK